MIRQIAEMWNLNKPGRLTQPEGGGTILGASRSNNLRHSADRITLLRDSDKDGIPEQRETFLIGLNQPFGMLVIGKWLYVGNTNSLVRYPYSAGQTILLLKVS